MTSCLPWFKFRSAAPEEYSVHALCAILGPEADAYLFRLWAYCGRERLDGRFPGPGAALAVERAVRWRGRRGKLVEAMVTLGLLVLEGEDLVVSSWAEEQGPHIAKVERDRAKPDGRQPNPLRPPSNLPPPSLQSPAREEGGEKGERREEKKTSQRRKAEETPSRERGEAAPSPPPRKAQGHEDGEASPSGGPRGILAGDEPLPDGIQREFREARGVAYTWKPGRDDPASRELLSLAGAGGVPEVLRRWGHGVRARFKQRCDTLVDLVRRWDANATPEEGSAPTGPSDPRRRAALEVGRGAEPSGPCATGCGGTSRSVVWGQPLCPRCFAALEADVPAGWTAATVSAWVGARRAATPQLQEDAHAV